jgi:hypothetical protein
MTHLLSVWAGFFSSWAMMVINVEEVVSPCAVQVQHVLVHDTTLITLEAFMPPFTSLQ